MNHIINVLQTKTFKNKEIIMKLSNLMGYGYDLIYRKVKNETNDFYLIHKAKQNKLLYWPYYFKDADPIFLDSHFCSFSNSYKYIQDTNYVDHCVIPLGEFDVYYSDNIIDLKKDYNFLNNYDFKKHYKKIEKIEQLKDLKDREIIISGDILLLNKKYIEFLISEKIKNLLNMPLKDFYDYVDRGYRYNYYEKISYSYILKDFDKEYTKENIISYIKSLRYRYFKSNYFINNNLKTIYQL